MVESKVPLLNFGLDLVIYLPNQQMETEAILFKASTFVPWNLGTMLWGRPNSSIQRPHGVTHLEKIPGKCWLSIHQEPEPIPQSYESESSKCFLFQPQKSWTSWCCPEQTGCFCHAPFKLLIQIAKWIILIVLNHLVL